MAGNLVLAGGNFRQNGPIAGNVKLAAGNALLSSTIGGFLHARVDTLHLSSQAEIGDNLIYWSGNQAAIEDGATIAGEVTRHQVTSLEVPKEELLKFLAGLRALSKLASLIAALFIGWLLIKICPRFTQATTQVIQRKPWQAFGIGLIFIIVVPVVFGLLVATLVGIKLAFILMSGFFILVAIATIFSMILLGYWIMRLFTKEVNLGWALLVGVVAYCLLTYIPVLGGFVSLVALLLGLGSLLIVKRDLFKELKAKKLI